MSAEPIKFYNLSIPERLEWLAEKAGLDAGDLAALQGGLTIEQADHMIENVVGVFSLPLGIALELRGQRARGAGADGRRRALRGGRCLLYGPPGPRRGRFHRPRRRRPR